MAGNVRRALWRYLLAHAGDYEWGPRIRARRFHDVVEVEEFGDGTHFLISAKFLLEQVGPELRGYDSAHNEAPPLRWLLRYAAFRPTALFGGYAYVWADAKFLHCGVALKAVYVPTRYVAEDLPWLYARQTAWEEDGRLVTAEEACRRGTKAACEALRRCQDCEWEGEVELYNAKYYLVQWD